MIPFSKMFNIEIGNETVWATPFQVVAYRGKKLLKIHYEDSKSITFSDIIIVSPSRIIVNLKCLHIHVDQIVP